MYPPSPLLHIEPPRASLCVGARHCAPLLRPVFLGRAGLRLQPGHRPRKQAGVADDCPSVCTEMHRCGAVRGHHERRHGPSHLHPGQVCQSLRHCCGWQGQGQGHRQPCSRSRTCIVLAIQSHAVRANLSVMCGGVEKGTGSAGERGLRVTALNLIVHMSVVFQHSNPCQWLRPWSASHRYLFLYLYSHDV